MDTGNFKEVFTSDETKQLRKRVAELETQRDELLNLLEEATSYTSCQSWSPSLTDEINAAIASVKDHFPDAGKMMRGAA